MKNISYGKKNICLERGAQENADMYVYIEKKWDVVYACKTNSCQG